MGTRCPPGRGHLSCPPSSDPKLRVQILSRKGFAWPRAEGFLPAGPCASPRGGPPHLWARRAGAHGADAAGAVVHLERESAVSSGTGAPAARGWHGCPEPNSHLESRVRLRGRGHPPGQPLCRRLCGGEVGLGARPPSTVPVPRSTIPILPCQPASPRAPRLVPIPGCPSPGPGPLHHLDLQELLFLGAPLEDLRGSRGSVLLGQTGRARCGAGGNPRGDVGASRSHRCPQPGVGAEPQRCRGAVPGAATAPFQGGRGG